MSYPGEFDVDDQPPVTPTPTPVDVRIINADESVSVKAATFGSWMTVSWPAATPANAAQFPMMLLPLDRKRRKAQLIIQIAAGYVLVGNKGQLANGVGGQLTSGRYPIENIQALYATSDGANAATITVLQERD